ncbi:isochorismatase hydrolase [Bacillus sp. TS-2]|nr:isochorismatase hydrolase [Bacillus sp. TS-2]
MNQALLIIDAQQDLIEGSEWERPVYGKEQLVVTINSVIEKAQNQNIPTIFVRDLDIAEGKGKGFDIHEKITRPARFKSFDKLATNAFYQTGLLEHLKKEHVNHLVIMGCSTQHCIDTAVRTATVNGFDVTLVADGHSTADNEQLSGDQIIQHHNQTLHGHYNVDHFSIVRTSTEDLFKPTHNDYRSK